MSTMKITNSEILEYLELPNSIATDLATQEGTQFQATANQFLNALVNKIVYQKVENMNFTNPFKRFDSYPVQYGDTIENVYVELPKGYTFDKDATDPFVKFVPSVKTLYATINYDLQYPVTIQDALLRRAAMTPYGFQNLIDSILATLNTSKEIDEYFATIRMLNNPAIYANGFENVTYAQGATDADKAKLITHTIVDVSSDFELPKCSNNKMAVMNMTQKSDILLVIKKNLLNMINLDYLAGVYNLSKVELLKNIITVDTFQTKNESGVAQGADIDFVILDTNGFDNHVALQDGGMIYNPRGKYTNHFLNLWKIMGFKYWANARAFKLTEAQE